MIESTTTKQRQIDKTDGEDDEDETVDDNRQVRTDIAKFLTYVVYYLCSHVCVINTDRLPNPLAL